MPNRTSRLARLDRARRTRPTYYRCGICDHYHSIKWDGDCRENDARFEMDQLDTMHGPLGWDEVDMPD
jgi:hypothetical protein